MPIGSILGGIIGAGGAQAAGAAAGQAGAQALQQSQDLANRNVARFSPWLTTGTMAEDQLSRLYGLGAIAPIGDQYNTYGTKYGVGTPQAAEEQKNALARFQTSPGYQFRLQEGVNALDRSASARGMVLSGAQKRAVSDYGQNTGSNEWGNYVSQLNSLAGGGISAAGGASTTANQALVPGINNAFQGDMARASSYSNAANALASGIMSGTKSAASLFGAFGGFGGSYGSAQGLPADFARASGDRGFGGY